MIEYLLYLTAILYFARSSKFRGGDSVKVSADLAQNIPSLTAILETIQEEHGRHNHWINMSGAKPRREVSSHSTTASQTPKNRRISALVNGNGSAHRVITNKDYPYENIFIFIPNVIGESLESYLSLTIR